MNNDDDRRGFNLLTARWLALGAAAGVALSLALAQAGIQGPWQGTALVLALLALFATTTMALAAGRHEARLREESERSRRGEAEVSALQQEINRHTQLESELTKAKQAAEAAVMAKGEFLATMSHEIRTPLNGIVPMLDLLMHSRMPPDQMELVRTAFTSSHQMLRIVDDILDYSKLEADKLELETTGFNLREVLESIITLMERPAEAKGLRLLLNIEQGVRLPVRGDPVRLRQVVSNLISNAVKFTERGSVTLNVKRLRESAAQHQLRFEVRDTGIGIGQDAQERLFQAFSQADASTTRLYGGTGLGLAICQRIVTLMGGSIGVESEPGQGSTFWFEIPLLKVQGDMPAREADLTGARVLLVTADGRLRQRLAMLLPNWGMRLTTAENTLRCAGTPPPGQCAGRTLDLFGGAGRPRHHPWHRAFAGAQPRTHGAVRQGQAAVPARRRHHARRPAGRCPGGVARHAGRRPARRAIGRGPGQQYPAGCPPHFIRRKRHDAASHSTPPAGGRQSGEPDGGATPAAGDRHGLRDRR